MSNYVQTTFFTPKDTLPTTNPAKTIFGAAYDVEFGNIATAIATKYDSTSIATGAVAFNIGTSSAPGITFTGHLTTGIYSNSNGDLGLTVANGVSALVISNTTGAVAVNTGSTASGGVAALSVNATNGLAAIAQVGSGTSGVNTTLNAQAGNYQCTIFLEQSGTVNAAIGLGAGASGPLTDATAGDFCVKAGSGATARAIRFGVNTSNTTALLISSSGSCTISTPGAGVALLVNGLSGTFAAQVSSGSGGSTVTTDLYVTRNGSTINTLGCGPNLQLADISGTNGTILQNSGGQTELWQNNSNGWRQMLAFNTTFSPIFANSPTATTATAGTSGAVPSQVVGYLVVVIGSTSRKVPYYAT